MNNLQNSVANPSFDHPPPHVRSAVNKCAALIFGAAMLALGSSSFAQVPEEYTATDITGWSASQLNSLPKFSRYVPTLPAPATPNSEFSNFKGVAQSDTGFITWIATTSGGVSLAGVVKNGVYQPSISYPGPYIRTTDINAAGLVTGYYNYNNTDTAFLYDSNTQTRMDLLPGVSQAYGINDSGIAIGVTNTGGFRRTAAGMFESLSGTPTLIDNKGQISGYQSVGIPGTVLNLPIIISPAGALQRLPFPPQGGPDTGQPDAMSETNVIVGRAWQALGTEIYAGVPDSRAARWHLDAATGQWAAIDLNELNATGGIILVRAIAVNDEGYVIATGRPDGVGIGGLGVAYRTYVLTPVGLTPPGQTLPPAIISATPSLTGTYNVPYSYTLSANGIPQPTYSLLSGPAGMTVNATTGQVAWTPSATQLGANPITLSATNSIGSANLTFSVNVVAPIPPTPTGLVSTGVTRYSISLAWNPVTPQLGTPTYRLIMQNATGAKGTTLRYEGPATNAVVTKLTPNTLYSFFVQSVASGQTSTNSAKISVRTAP